jgi:hypothetical protein
MVTMEVHDGTRDGGRGKNAAAAGLSSNSPVTLPLFPLPLAPNSLRTGRKSGERGRAALLITQIKPSDLRTAIPRTRES